MCSISILVTLETSSLIANSSASEAVVLLAETLENDTWWPIFYKCIVETACMFWRVYHLHQTRVEWEEVASRKRWFRDSRWAVQFLRLELLQEWKEMKSGKLSSSLQPSIASASKKLKYSVRLRRNASVFRRRPFKWVH